MSRTKDPQPFPTHTLIHTHCLRHLPARSSHRRRHTRRMWLLLGTSRGSCLPSLSVTSGGGVWSRSSSSRSSRRGRRCSRRYTEKGCWQRTGNDSRYVRMSVCRYVRMSSVHVYVCVCRVHQGGCWQRTGNDSRYVLMCACVCVCVRACACACVCVCVYV
jgi:hypothetical protein